MTATFSRPGVPVQSLPAARLAGFREELYRCLTSRRDGLFGVADAVLCAGGRVTDLARLSLVPEAGRGHGGVYDAVSAGRIEAGRLRGSRPGPPGAVAGDAAGHGRCARGIFTCAGSLPLSR